VMSEGVGGIFGGFLRKEAGGWSLGEVGAPMIKFVVDRGRGGGTYPPSTLLHGKRKRSPQSLNKTPTTMTVVSINRNDGDREKLLFRHISWTDLPKEIESFYCFGGAVGNDQGRGGSGGELRGMVGHGRFDLLKSSKNSILGIQ